MSAWIGTSSFTVKIILAGLAYYANPGLETARRIFSPSVLGSVSGLVSTIQVAAQQGRRMNYMWRNNLIFGCIVTAWKDNLLKYRERPRVRIPPSPPLYEIKNI